ncbi:MAG: hypothetical protein HYS98_05405 [Deltaproteobacteria bacterium]|nr:hypothetical protein [Deltaproteobacteria bacterium]
MKNILIFERALFIYLGATVLTSVLSDNPFQSLSKISEVFSYVVLYFFLSRKFFVSESRIYKTLFCIGFLFALGYSSTLLLHTFYLMPKLPSWLSFLHAGKIEMDQPFIIRWIQGLHYYGFIRDGRIKFINGAVSCSLNSAILFFIFFGMSAFYKKYKTYSKKWFFIWGYILIFALAVFFSYSRATLFAFIVFGMTVGFYYLPRKSKYVFSIICFLFVCGMFFNKFLFTKMTQETYKSFSKRHKLPAWKKTLHYIIHESSPKILIFG